MVNFHVVVDMEQGESKPFSDFNLKVEVVYQENLTDFRKTEETGVSGLVVDEVLDLTSSALPLRQHAIKRGRVTTACHVYDDFHGEKAPM